MAILTSGWGITVTQFLAIAVKLDCVTPIWNYFSQIKIAYLRKLIAQTAKLFFFDHAKLLNYNSNGLLTRSEHFSIITQDSLKVSCPAHFQ